MPGWPKVCTKLENCAANPQFICAEISPEPEDTLPISGSSFSMSISRRNFRKTWYTKTANKDVVLFGKWYYLGSLNVFYNMLLSFRTWYEMGTIAATIQHIEIMNRMMSSRISPGRLCVSYICHSPDLFICWNKTREYFETNYDIIKISMLIYFK